MGQISVVVNTYNEEKIIARCLDSVKPLVDEIVVVDMHSTDRTVEIARKYQAKIYYHHYTCYVEPARNFALSKATGKWILLLDADEQLPSTLVQRLKEIVKVDDCDFVEIPRKNIIFGKWIEHSRWWPDYLIRFFKNGAVEFSEKIHQPPTAKGKGRKLEQANQYALHHYHYTSINQYLERLNRYSDIQAEELRRKDYRFKGEDLLTKPANEFFSRYFAGQGYQDGLHGLVLALLQAFSELAVYLKVWENDGFKRVESLELNQGLNQTSRELAYWQQKIASGWWERLILKIKSKL